MVLYSGPLRGLRDSNVTGNAHSVSAQQELEDVSIQ